MKTRSLSLLLTSSLFVLLQNSCSHIPLEDGATSVAVYYSLNEKTNCDYVGDVIGSDGNVMTFLFMSNTSLTRGALNDVRNKARAMGGDTVFIIREQLLYRTSTTFVGSVYNCENVSENRPTL